MFQATITALRDQKSKEFGTCHGKCLWEQHKPGKGAPLGPSLRRGGAGGGAGRAGGCRDSARGVRPAPRLGSARLGSLSPRETTRRPRAERRCRRAAAGLGRGCDRPGAARESGRSCCRGPERRRFASFLPSRPGRAGLRRGRGGGTGARGAERGGRAGGGRRRRGRDSRTLHLQVHLAHLGEPVAQIHGKLLDHCGDTGERERGGREGASQSLAAVGEGGRRLLAAASPGSPAPAVPGRPAPPPRTHSLSR